MIFMRVYKTNHLGSNIHKLHIGIVDRRITNKGGWLCPLIPRKHFLYDKRLVNDIIYEKIN